MSVFSVLADVLMVGHSLFGGNLPVLTEEALRQMRGPAVVEAQIINGAPLGFNWENAANAEGVDARARLAEMEAAKPATGSKAASVREHSLSGMVQRARVARSATGAPKQYRRSRGKL